MNSISMSLAWCVLQVTIVCCVALALGAIYRRLRGRTLISTSSFALIVVLGLTAFALSPWPSWNFQQQQAAKNIPTNLATLDARSEQESAGQRIPLSTKVIPREPTVWNSMLTRLSIRVGDQAERLARLALPLLILSLAVGSGRFAVGLFAIWRTVKSSDPIEDENLNHLMGGLRSKLGCDRTIRLLESDRIRSPATVGWRQPTILLPPGWREWPTMQTRAVLAHEISHIVRNDFGSLLLAQLSVAFHFYHPLVHRLVENLRLEQELAADSAAAIIVGGNQPYLAVLATMALQDQRAGTEPSHSPWLAKPFLPAPKTLLRRIEMLQAKKTFNPSGAARARNTGLAIILVVGIAAVGLRPVAVTAQEKEQPANDKKNVEPINFPKLIFGNGSQITAAEREEIGSRLKRMYEENPDDLDIKNRYADLLLAAGDLPKALPILRDLSGDNPIRGLQAAAVARRLKMYKEANIIADRSLDALRTMSVKEPANLVVALAVAQNQLFLKRYTESIKTLEKAIEVVKTPQDQEVARTACGDAIAAFVNHLEDSSTGSIRERVRILKMLQRALTVAPNNPRVLTVISQQLHETRDDDNEQITALRDALVEALKAAEKAKDIPEEGIPAS